MNQNNQTDYRINKITPKCGYVVWCHREFDGKVLGWRLAKRLSENPYNEANDPSLYCCWRGFNENEGRTWSDITVREWKPLIDIDTHMNLLEACKQALHCLHTEEDSLKLQSMLENAISKAEGGAE